jgi:hypothetical protein
MDHIALFLSVLATAVREVEIVCAEKRSDYWDTLGAVLRDRNFIEMVVAEMKDPAVGWQAAIGHMLAKSERKLSALPNREIAEYAIELRGACQFLLDGYGASGPQ